MSGKKWRLLVCAGVMLASLSIAYAGPVEDRSNPVPNGSIVIDDSVADWAGVVPFSLDANDVTAGLQDWKQIFMAHDDTYLYFRFERYPGSMPFNGAATVAAPAGGGGYWVVMDTDENHDTGRNLAGTVSLSVGGEFSSAGFTQINRWGAGGLACGLGGFPYASTSLKPPVVFEASIARSQLGNPTDFNIAFRGENSSDYYPNGAGTTDYFHYTTGTPIASLPAGMVASLSNPVPNGSISIDTDLSDWTTVTPYPLDTAGDGGTSQDWLQVSIAHDDNNFYFRVERAPTGVAFTSPGYWGIIDTDRNAATGIKLAGNVGAEFNFGGTNGFNAWNEAGGFVSSFAWTAVGFTAPTTIEAAVRRSDIGDPASMNLVFVGTDGSEFYPDNGFSSDYFHYTVHPPTPVGGDPIEVATLSNKVPNGAMVMDGNFDDWASIPSFPTDAAGDGGTGQDWVRASIAHDDTNLYMLVERAPGSATFTGGLQQGYWIVLDTDLNQATGFTGFGARSFSVGGEYNWGGDATNAWDAMGCFNHVVPTVRALPPTPPSEAEFAISRVTLGNPTDFNVAFIGENSLDLYPDSAATAVFHYTTGTPLSTLPADIAASLSNPVADGAITVDGNLSDWAALTPYPADPSGDGGTNSQDWVQVWIAHDTNNFYFRMKRAGNTVAWNTPGYWGVFDTDRNYDTGVKLGGTHIGAEFNTGGIINLNRWNAAGGYAGAATFAATAQSVPNNTPTMIETSIPRSELGNPSRFRVIFVGENSGDYYPEGANADKTFLYTFLPCATPFADADKDGDVDQDDFGIWQACFTGDGGLVTGGCECFDRDFGDQGDGDIDAADLTKFLSCMSGPSIPANKNCGG